MNNKISFHFTGLIFAGQGVIKIWLRFSMWIDTVTLSMVTVWEIKLVVPKKVIIEPI
jgi:hypothetical protein